MSILRVNRSKTKHCVLHNGMITWDFLPDIFKVNLSFSMFKSKVRNFYLEKYWKILMLGGTMIAFFLIFSGFSSVTVFGFGYFAVKFPIISFVVIIRITYMQECYCKLDMFLVSETIIVRPFQRN